MQKDPCNPRIISLLKEKASVKQEVYRNGKKHFEQMKKQVAKIAGNLSDNICEFDASVKVEYKDKNPFECEVYFGGDVMLMSMHTNVFTFDRSHNIWRNSYIREDPSRAYFSMFVFYNFLADSIRFNRYADHGLLLGRLFVNRENFFFIEGRKHLSYMFSNFGHQELNEQNKRKVVETAVIQSLEHDLTVPEYKDIANVSVKAMKENSNKLQLKTEKKAQLGYYSRMQRR